MNKFNNYAESLLEDFDGKTGDNLSVLDEAASNNILEYEYSFFSDDSVKIPVIIKLGQYSIKKFDSNKKLAIELVSVEDGYEEPFGSLTVNLPEEDTADDCAFVDVNNLSGAEEFIKKYNLGEPTGITAKSGFVTYPLYKFNMERLTNLATGAMTESLAQEIGQAYTDLDNKYGQNFEELIYGPAGFMTDCYPHGFPDFKGDIIYSEKYWKEFEAWLKEKHNITLTETLSEAVHLKADNQFLNENGFSEGLDNLGKAGYTIDGDINIAEFNNLTKEASIDFELNVIAPELTWDFIYDNELDTYLVKHTIEENIKSAFDYADAEYEWQADVDISTNDIEDNVGILHNDAYLDSEGQWMPEEAELEGEINIVNPIYVVVNKIKIN